MNLQGILTSIASLALIAIIASCTCSQSAQTEEQAIVQEAPEGAPVVLPVAFDDDDSLSELNVSESILEASHDMSAIHSYLIDSNSSVDHPSIERYENMPEPMPLEPKSRAGRKKVLDKRGKHNAESRRGANE